MIANHNGALTTYNAGITNGDSIICINRNIISYSDTIFPIYGCLITYGNIVPGRLSICANI